MDAAEFTREIERHGWKWRDRFHIDTGDHSLVRPGAISRDYGKQLAALLRRKAAIESVRQESEQERLTAGGGRRKGADGVGRPRKD